MFSDLCKKVFLICMKKIVEPQVVGSLLIHSKLMFKTYNLECYGFYFNSTVRFCLNGILLKLHSLKRTTEERVTFTMKHVVVYVHFLFFFSDTGIEMEMKQALRSSVDRIRPLVL